MPLNLKPSHWIFLAWVALAIVAAIGGSENLQTIAALTLLMVVLPLVIATYLDWVSMRERPEGVGALGVIVRASSALPGVLFGLIAMLMGLAIIAWVTYNFCIEPQEEFTGSTVFLSYGIAPGMVAFGYFTAVGACSGLRRVPAPDEDSARVDGDCDEEG